MERYTQKQLRALVRTNAAEEIKNTTDGPRPGELTQIGYAAGVYGINGALLRRYSDGKLFAIIGRSSALFFYC
jgi:hypothetical protein